MRKPLPAQGTAATWTDATAPLVSCPLTQHVVRRGNLDQLPGVGLVPLPGLGRDQARYPREVARHEAQGVDDVPVGASFPKPIS
jgi:hypothetical protein